MDPNSEQLKKERSRYYVFRERTNTLAKKILESYNQYYSVQKLISESYQVNSEPADQGAIAKDMRKLKDCYDMLINSTMPAINSKINNLTYEIKQIEQREETAAERAAEEARARAEAAYYERVWLGGI